MWPLIAEAVSAVGAEVLLGAEAGAKAAVGAEATVPFKDEVIGNFVRNQTRPTEVDKDGKVTHVSLRDRVAGGIKDQVVKELQKHLGYGEVTSYIPTYFHSITVQVIGGPGADLRRVWQLALATVFGRYKRGLRGVSGRTLACQWDITGKVCDVTMAYTYSGVLDTGWGLASGGMSGIEMIQQGPDQVTIGAGFPSFFRSTRQNTSIVRQFDGLLDMVGGSINRIASYVSGQLSRASDMASTAFTGSPPQHTVSPTQNLTSDDWIFFYGDMFRADNVPLTLPKALAHGGYVPNVLRELPSRIGLPNSPDRYWTTRALAPSSIQKQFYICLQNSFLGSVPILPDDGRIITTGEKLDVRVQNPRPPVDGISKGSVLAMISQTLQTPGYLVSSPRVNGGAAPVASSGLHLYPPNATNNFVVSGIIDAVVDTGIYAKIIAAPALGSTSSTAPNVRPQ